MESGRSVRTISASDTDTIINSSYMIHLKLPLPPSVNTAFAGKEIRYKSVAYKEWENIADKALRQQEQYTITGDHWLTATYVLHINLYTQKWAKRIIDCANYEKCISDFLGGYVDPVSRKSLTRRYIHLWVQRIPWFQDHKILSNTQMKKQKQAGEEDWIEVMIDEI